MIEKIGNHVINRIKGKRIFMDANILLYIFWPTSSPKWVKEYSGFFKKLLENKISIVTDRTTISEFINRALKLEYESHLRENNLDKKTFPFKEFRDQNYGLETIREIYTITKEKILNQLEYLDKSYSKEEIINILKNEKGDFNDQLIVRFCEENSLLFLTNDGDFINTDLNILTANPVLLKK
jgi:predicted nucleic acid-binding protein